LYALYDRIYRFDVLLTAWWLVLAHKGAPGVDGMPCQDIIDSPGADASIKELSEELRTKRYRPQPVKRVSIPKPDGRMRPLGIPCPRPGSRADRARAVFRPHPRDDRRHQPLVDRYSTG
jgi:RNA-directed DNA polymerase